MWGCSISVVFFFKQKTAYEIDMRLEFRRVLFRSQQRLVAERRLELPRFLSAQLGMNGDRAARLQRRGERRSVERNRLVAAAELKRLVFYRHRLVALPSPPSPPSAPAEARTASAWRAPAAPAAPR